MRLVLINIFFSLFFHLYGGIVSDGLSQISLNDALCIKKFVEINLKWHQMGHVIFFENKPMSLATVYLRSPQKLPMDTFWIKGWKAFKKNEHLFPHPNFIFNSSINESEPGWKWINLFVINKRALIKCLEKHSDIFHEILGQKYSIDWLITEFESGKKVYEILKNDERLLGILLGYGEEAATAFHDAINSHKGIPSHTCNYCPVEAKTSKGCKLHPMVMMGNPNSTEVQTLISVYSSELEKFWQIYYRQDPLEFFLKCICEEIK